MMQKFPFLFFLLAGLCGLACEEVVAQTCDPSATLDYIKDGKPVTEENAESYSGSAPLHAVFTANPSDVEDYDARYEWVIYEEGREQTPLIHRFDETLEYTFNQSGTFVVELTATFVLGNDTITYPDEGEQPKRFSISISTSLLEMPNAFSPNNDGWNDVYKPKTQQSIISFKATIFNRWGQKLYSWDDVNGEWDGTVNGKVVQDGVYFVNVVAKGADGHEFHIRKDVNVLTRSKKDSTSSEGTSGGTN